MDRLKHPGRNEILSHLERKYVDLHPENLPEGAKPYDKIETEQLEYDPARLFATVYRRHKYKLEKADGTTEFYIAELPAEKDKSLAAPSQSACDYRKISVSHANLPTGAEAGAKRSDVERHHSRRLDQRITYCYPEYQSRYYTDRSFQTCRMCRLCLLAIMLLPMRRHRLGKD